MPKSTVINSNLIVRTNFGSSHHKYQQRCAPRIEMKGNQFISSLIRRWALDLKHGKNRNKLGVTLKAQVWDFRVIHLVLTLRVVSFGGYQF